MKFVWQSDESPPTYFNWRSGEPNNNWGGEDEDCVRISGKRYNKGSWVVENEFKWNDNPCNLAGGNAICQK